MNVILYRETGQVKPLPESKQDQAVCLALFFYAEPGRYARDEIGEDTPKTMTAFGIS